MKYSSYTEFILFIIYVQQGTNSKYSLTRSDEHDLIEIIQKVIPEAPKFKVILESQLRNAKAKDPKHRRWSPEMISLCLNLWAKY